MLIIFSAFPSKKEAEKTAKTLVAKNLAKCASIFPCSSIYKWKGKMQNEKEWVLELKASEGNYKKIETFLLSIHPYELPAIYAVKAERISGKFNAWIRD